MKNLIALLTRKVGISQNKNLSFSLCLCLILFSFHAFAQAPDTWTQKTDFGGTGRAYAVSFSIDNKGYIGTGYDGIGPFKQDFWEWDQTTNSWTQKADFGGGVRYAAFGFSIGNKGYIGTGSDGVINKKDFWEWDQATNVWIQKANFAGTARSTAVGFSIGTKGYVGTGNDVGPGGDKNDFWEWDQSTNAWTEKTPLTGVARNGATGFSIGTKGYIATGANYGSASYMNDFWEWDQITNNWTQKTGFPGTPRYAAISFSINKKGYIGTGSIYGCSPIANDFWEWDQETNAWQQRANLSSATRRDAVGLSIGGKGYVGLGHFDGCASKSNDFWEYTPSLEVNAGPDKTVYFGYPPEQCTKLKGSATGGTPPYLYSWSNGSTVNEISVCPKTTTDFILTVTDFNGYSVTDTVLVNVVDVRCGKGKDFGKSVYVCHSGTTLCVKYPEAKKHIDHGDNLGSCTSFVRMAVNMDSSIVDDEDPLALYPNPTTGLFTVEVCKKNIVEEARIEIVNSVGQVVYTKTPFKTEGCIKETIELKSDLPEGLYFLNLIIGEKVETRKLILTK